MKYALQPYALNDLASASGTLLGDLGKCLEEVSPGDGVIKAYAWSPILASCCAFCQPQKE